MDREPFDLDDCEAPGRRHMPDEPRRCERCGDPLPAPDALGGACPRCMLELGLEPAGDSNPSVAWGRAGTETRSVERSPAIARYRVLRVIGEGGMGTVYEAEQDHPRRTVALKLLKPGLSNPKLLRRF